MGCPKAASPKGGELNKMAMKRRKIARRQKGKWDIPNLGKRTKIPN
jgi:hypothetical protein